ncbi:MAG: ArsR family transcriptional regulator [Desulfurococcales archaeon]|nr:ArsR family transcriptional regulator [Desulfurococcales archaeon]
MESREDPLVNLSKILSILAHPTRLKILALCAVKERTARELREELGISKPLLIAHLKQLINYGFIESRAEIDEERFIIKKYYKTKKFEIKINDEILASLLRK